jgi:hypothetical protein
MRGSTLVRRLGATLALASSLVLAACGGAAPEPSAPEASATPERARDAHRIASELVGGRVGGLLHVERLRGHPLGRRLLGLGEVRALLEGSDLDPLVDLERVYVTGPSASERRAVVFAEHKLDETRVDRAVAQLVEKSQPRGQLVLGKPYPVVRVQRGDGSGLVAFLPPRFVVVVPEDLEARIDDFANTGGLPGPEGAEAASIVAWQPSETLRAHGAPPVPASVAVARARVTLQSGGGALVEAEGDSASPEQAELDAAELQASIDRATTVQLGFVRMKVFRTIPFRSEESRVLAQVDLSASELAQLLGLAEMAMRR